MKIGNEENYQKGHVEYEPLNYTDPAWVSLANERKYVD